MAFGVKRIPLPKDDFGLDEDGWIEVLVYATARMSLIASQPYADDLARIDALMREYVRGWKLKMGGEELACKKEMVLDLPGQVLETLTGEIQRLPLAGTKSTSSAP